MPKRKGFYKKSVSVGVLSSALFIAGCGTAETVTEQPAESEETEVATTTASGDSDESEEEEEESPEEETEPAEAEEPTESDAASSGEGQEQAVPEDQAGIGTTFPLGTALSELVDHYGTPTYDEFFMGGRLVVFNEEDGYFLDGDEIVTGFMITRPEVNIFGANVGMTFPEVKAVLPNSEEVFFDQAETQDYANVYYVEGYNVVFFAGTEDGPTEYAIVTRNK